jgi:hypothetical protein
LPELGDTPSANKSKDDIIVIIINGINTIIQEMMPKPLSHKKFNTNENPIININFKIAVLYMVLNISIIICVVEKIKYNITGVHKFSSIYK